MRMRGALCACARGVYRSSIFFARRSVRPREPNAHARWSCARARVVLAPARKACSESPFFLQRSVRPREPNELVWTWTGQELGNRGGVLFSDCWVVGLEPARLPGSRSLASAPPEVAPLAFGLGVGCCIPDWGPLFSLFTSFCSSRLQAPAACSASPTQLLFVHQHSPCTPV